MKQLKIQFRNSRKSRHSGMALMLVIPAVALATVLSYAVLTNVGTQNQVSANAALLAQADGLAESGINYAMYELQQPIFNSVVWPGTPASTSLGGNGSATFSVTVTPMGFASDGTLTAKVTSTGTVGNESQNPIARQITIMVQIPMQTGSTSTSPFGTGNVTITAGGTTNLNGFGPPAQVPKDVQVTRWSQQK